MNDWDQHPNGSANPALALDPWGGFEYPSFELDRDGLGKWFAFTAAALWSSVAWASLVKLSAYLIP